MYMNTGRPRPWTAPKKASDARLRAMVKHLMTQRNLMEPHEAFGLAERAKTGLLPVDKVAFLSLMESWQD